MALTIAHGRATRVVLVDDQALLRAGMRAMLETHDDLTVVGEAAGGRDGVTVVLERRPDVVVMNIALQGVDAVEATRRLAAAHSPARVLVLTSGDDADAPLRAMAAGAAGCISADGPVESLPDAVRAVAAGRPVLSPEATQRLIDAYAEREQRETSLGGRFRDLTVREVQILRLMARGLSNGEMSSTLVLSEATVKTHVTRILGKLGVSSRVQAVVLAYESGFVRLGEAFPAETATPLRVVG
jgi:DNA-binding NarL/FixJ family response regulator